MLERFAGRARRAFENRAAGRGLPDDIVFLLRAADAPFEPLIQKAFGAPCTFREDETITLGDCARRVPLCIWSLTPRSTPCWKISGNGLKRFLSSRWAEAPAWPERFPFPEDVSESPFRKAMICE